MTDWRLQVVLWCRNHFNVLLTTFSAVFIAASAFSIYMEFDQAYLEADFRVWLAIISCKLLLKLVLTWSLTLCKSNSSCTTHASSLKSAISFVDWFGLIWFFIGHLLLLMNLDGLHTFPLLFACVCAYLAYMYAYYTCTLALYLHLGSYPPVCQEDRELLDTLGVAICLDGNNTTSSSNPSGTGRQEGKKKSLAHSTALLYREKWQAWLAQRGCTERRGDTGGDIEMGGGGGEGETALCAICLHPLAAAIPAHASPVLPVPVTPCSSSTRCCADVSVPDDANPSGSPSANPSASAANPSTNTSAANPSDPSPSDANPSANPSANSNPGANSNPSATSASAANPSASVRASASPTSANPSSSSHSPNPSATSASASAMASASAVASRDGDVASGAAAVVSFPCHRSSGSAQDGRTTRLLHEFHAACLHTWLDTQHAQQQQRQRQRRLGTSSSSSSSAVGAVEEGEEGLLTCPVCRQPPRCRSRGGNKGTGASAADSGDVV